MQTELINSLSKNMNAIQVKNQKREFFKQIEEGKKIISERNSKLRNEIRNHEQNTRRKIIEKFNKSKMDSIKQSQQGQFLIKSYNLEKATK